MTSRAPLSQYVARVLLVAALALQSYLLYMPAEGEGSLPPGADKIGHAAMFGGPTLLGLVAGWRWVALLLLAYAPCSEVLQGIPAIQRDPDWHDVVADVTGIIAAGVGVEMIRRRRVG